jgi:hypothetical protein
MTREEGHLAQADQHIAEADRRVTEQEQRLDDIQASGRDPTEAVRLLTNLQSTLREMRQHRRIILDEIDRQ